MATWRKVATAIGHRWVALALALAVPPPLMLLVAGHLSAPKIDTPLSFQRNAPRRAIVLAPYRANLYPTQTARAAMGGFAARSMAFEKELARRPSVENSTRVVSEREERLRKAMQLMEMRLLAQLVTERHREDIERSIRVTLLEEMDYYERHKHELVEEPHFTAQLLVVYVKGNPAFPNKGLTDAQARERATAALSRLRAGDPWDIVVPAYSDEVDEHRKGGLVREGKFGYFAQELERAIRTQELGKPGELIRTQFGYHVVEVLERLTETRPRSFESAREIFAERLNRQKAEATRLSLMQPIWAEVGFKLEAAGMLDVSLLNERAVPPSAPVAVVAGKRVVESDFQWFLRDAFLPHQRAFAFSRPSARQSALRSYLDMLVLEAKARRDGLDKSEGFIRNRDAALANVRAEFATELDQAKRSPSALQR